MRRAFALDPSAIVAAVALVFVMSASLSAQTGILAGTVYRDTANHPLTTVQITIGPLDRRTTTNYAGEFRFRELPAGTYVLTFRHIGFAPLTDTVVITGSTPIDREYVMTEQPIELGGVSVNETNKTATSPGLSEFKERSKVHNGGFFITEAEIRRNETRKLADLLTSFIPGIRRFRPLANSNPGLEYLASARNACNGPVFQCNGQTPCPLTIYINGNLFFSPTFESGSNTPGMDMPDINDLKVTDYSGIEYYPGGASVPAKYNASINRCGVLLLWGRLR